MDYNDKMSWYNEYYVKLYGFNPKSFWEFFKNTEFDKLITDNVAEKTLQEEMKAKKISPTYNKDWGARTALSKFNSEYAKRLIEFFTCKGDYILDPFAGRTRQQICKILERKYLGFEINKKYLQKEEIINDDCWNIDKHLSEQNKIFDCLFTCPPYWNMEVYSTDIENDLSRCKTYEKFYQEYAKRIQKSFEYVKEEGIGIIVVADFRKDGQFIPLHYDTIKIMKEINWNLYDVIILEMNPNARYCYYAQAVTKRRMLTTHEYALIFTTDKSIIEDKKFQEDLQIIKNPDIHNTKIKTTKSLF